MDEHDATTGTRQAGEHHQDRPAAGGRGRPGAAGAALAVVAVAGTALGAVLLRPGRSLTARSGGPLDNSAVVILIALGCLAAGVLLSSHYRSRLGYDQNLPSFEQRLADAVRVTLIAAAVVVPVLLLSMHDFPSGGGSPAPEQTGDDDFPHRTLPPFTPHPGSGAGHVPSITLPHLLVVAGIAVLVLALLVAGYRLWRQLRRTEVPPPAGTYRPAEQDVLADAVDSGRRALLDGTDARAAVIACYAAMETSLAHSGIARRASDSPQDLLARAAGSGLLTGPHATDLTALFREARYSTHPMDGTHRDRAAAALDAIAAQLAERAAAADDPQPAADDPQPPSDTPPAGGTGGPQPRAGAHR
ncbi:DUF4129 domain-containing protein [Streptomyces cocklensis]|uniref:Protein-glutamine gamma-glutamyltransferase-like C-terminal domain-containing protein n=1 Tax=Actinacidiphila cocklensis TaxID=887465 RepID=A0A9W4DVA1_9ACTN|nr:DUF4129 domain-containing protein [Actinacidiphila cocklensis]MDD1059708.1 DUF4129 domain-containing protein [Actinacidiphila cocklensis]WSX72581.1 DUF4129 domain-containing protein [Streptomyces sp. NBC_00899]WSX81350.1 DUF4129 domain-containing protein [Streptomyces sp. NBC_00899]CAG6396980.1 conserved membrane hypothetical protein [Actinacidiphila cocklensis]